MLKRKDILQANSTIIAGLLILLAVQSTGTPTLEETTLGLDALKDEVHEYNQTLTQDKQLAITELHELSKDPNNLEKKFNFEQTDKRLEKDLDILNEIQLKLSIFKSKVDVESSVPSNLINFSYPQNLVSIMLIPFVILLLLK